MKFVRFSLYFGTMLSLGILFQCNGLKFEVQDSAVAAPPDDLYFIDKMGIPTEEFLNLRQTEIASYKKNKLVSRNSPNTIPGQWTVQGPGNLGGRVNAIAINPQDENIIFIGFSHGGAYRTLDGGNSWTPVFDEQTSLYISDIAIDPINTRTIYITTGDHSGGFYCGQGNGIYKSLDNGNTWNYLGLSETRVLSEVLIDYKNPNIVYTASLGYSYSKNEHRGLYKSIDGGMNWNKILFINDSAGITDIAMHPTDPEILFAVSWNKLGTNNRSVINGPDGQIYKSVDGGNQWKKLTNGLPSDSINGRIAIAISQSNPNIIYARYVRTYRCGNQLTNNLYAIYRSDDTGESWIELPSLQSGSGLNCDCTGGFGWYFHSIAVNPKDPDDLYILAVDMFRSKDGGHQWELAVPGWNSYVVHADKHELKFFSNGDKLLGTDGGLYKGYEDQDQWDDIENIPTNQVYRVAHNPNEPGLYYGGLQDNGSTGGNDSLINSWERIYGGDGFQMAFKKDDPLIYYAEYQNGNLQQYNNGNWDNFTRRLNGSKNWDFPYMISRHNSRKLIAGSNAVYFNAHDSSANWSAISPNLVSSVRYPSRSNPTITTLDESPLDSNIIIAGTVNGNIWITNEFNTNWRNVSSLPAAYVTSVKTSYINPSVFYATLSAHRSNNFTAYVYKTEDNGNSWQSIHSDLPQLPVYDVLVYPHGNDSVLFVGNHIGVYASLDAGNSWLRVGDNMPFIEVFDLEINEIENTLIAATFGKSIMTFPIDDILKTIVSVKDQAASIPIYVYPNPANDEIRILGLPDFNNISEISIVDHIGKIVLRAPKDIQANKRINIAHLPNGLYFLRVQSGKNFKTTSFLKQS